MEHVANATFRAQALKLDGQGRPVCGSCGKVALHANVWVNLESGGLVVACTRCKRVFATLEGPVLAAEVREAMANQ